MDSNTLLLTDFSKICRVCLNKNEKLQPFHEMNEEIVTIFQNATQLDLEQDDDFPENMCPNCLLKLKFLCIFVLQCRESDLTLKCSIVNFDHNYFEKKENTVLEQKICISDSDSEETNELSDRSNGVIEILDCESDEGELVTNTVISESEILTSDSVAVNIDDPDIIEEINGLDFVDCASDSNELMIIEDPDFNPLEIYEIFDGKVETPTDLPENSDSDSAIVNSSDASGSLIGILEIPADNGETAGTIIKIEDPFIDKQIVEKIIGVFEIDDSDSEDNDKLTIKIELSDVTESNQNYDSNYMFEILDDDTELSNKDTNCESENSSVNNVEDTTDPLKLSDNGDETANQVIEMYDDGSNDTELSNKDTICESENSSVNNVEDVMEPLKLSDDGRETPNPIENLDRDSNDTELSNKETICESENSSVNNVEGVMEPLKVSDSGRETQLVDCESGFSKDIHTPIPSDSVGASNKNEVKVVKKKRGRKRKCESSTTTSNANTARKKRCSERLSNKMLSSESGTSKDTKQSDDCGRKTKNKNEFLIGNMGETRIVRYGDRLKMCSVNKLKKMNVVGYECYYCRKFYSTYQDCQKHMKENQC